MEFEVAKEGVEEVVEVELGGLKENFDVAVAFAGRVVVGNLEGRVVVEVLEVVGVVVEKGVALGAIIDCIFLLVLNERALTNDDAVVIFGFSPIFESPSFWRFWRLVTSASSALSSSLSSPLSPPLSSLSSIFTTSAMGFGGLGAYYRSKDPIPFFLLLHIISGYFVVQQIFGTSPRILLWNRRTLWA